jgi:hypothetical protein
MAWIIAALLGGDDPFAPGFRARLSTAEGYTLWVRDEKSRLEGRVAGVEFAFLDDGETVARLNLKDRTFEKDQSGVAYLRAEFAKLAAEKQDRVRKEMARAYFDPIARDWNFGRPEACDKIAGREAERIVLEGKSTLTRLKGTHVLLAYDSPPYEFTVTAVDESAEIPDERFRVPADFKEVPAEDSELDDAREFWKELMDRCS